MIKYIYHRVKDDMARKQNKMEENQEKRKLKKVKERTEGTRGKNFNFKRKGIKFKIGAKKWERRSSSSNVDMNDNM